jgi:hypothetical protein
MDGLGYDSDQTFVARGDTYPDALTAGPVAGNSNNVIVLTNGPTSLGAGIPAYAGLLAVGTGGGEIGNLHALGLTAALSDAVMQSAAASVGTLLP